MQLAYQNVFEKEAREDASADYLLGVLDGVLAALEDIDADGSPTFKLADVEENRPQAKKGQGMNKKQRDWRLKLGVGDISKANLYVGF